MYSYFPVSEPRRLGLLQPTISPSGRSAATSTHGGFLFWRLRSRLHLVIVFRSILKPGPHRSLTGPLNVTFFFLLIYAPYYSRTRPPLIGRPSAASQLEASAPPTPTATLIEPAAAR
ncbi:hypothetical protein VTO42DRAFT_597 [Malbranchea cinnamomea]